MEPRVCRTGTRDVTSDTTRKQNFTRGSRKVRPPERNVRSADKNGRPADRNLTPAKRNGRPADRNLTPADENGRPLGRNLTFEAPKSDLRVELSPVRVRTPDSRWPQAAVSHRFATFEHGTLSSLPYPVDALTSEKRRPDPKQPSGNSPPGTALRV